MVSDDAGVVHPPLNALWRRDGVAMGCNAVATVLVGAASFAIAKMAVVTPQARTAFTLSMMTAWIVLATAPLASAARTRLGSIARAGIMADASLVVLLILVFAGSRPLSLLSALKIYLLWAALAITAALVVGRGMSRLVGAAAISLVVLAVMAHPFWAGPARPSVARALAAVDPWNAVLDAAAAAVPDSHQGQPAWPTATAAWWAAAVLIAAAIGAWRAIRGFVRGT